MIRLFYTGAKKYLGDQANPKESLGGFISSSEIPDGYLNNLFIDVSLSDLNNRITETKVIALKNDSLDKLSNLKIYYVYPDNSNVKLEIGLIAPTINSCNEMLFEKLPDSKTQPKFVKLYEANVNYERVTIDISSSIKKGDELVITDNGSIISTIKFNLNNNIDNYLDYIVAKFSHEDYLIEKIFDKDLSKFILKLTKVKLGVDEGGLIEFKVLGDQISSPSYLSGLVDNSIDIDDVAKESYIGLFLRRSSYKTENLDDVIIDNCIKFIFEFN